MSGQHSLKELFEDDGLAWLLEKLQRNFARRGCFPDTAMLTLNNPDSIQQRAFARLLGRPIKQNKALRITIGQLVNILQTAELCKDFKESMLKLYPGLFCHSEAQRRQEALVWQGIFQLDSYEIVIRPEHKEVVKAWLDMLGQTGLLKRLSGNNSELGRCLVKRCLAVLACLPAEGIALAELAALSQGDSHALDPGEPVATLCLKYIERFLGVNAPSLTRDLWSAVGVLCDELSAPALTLNLRVKPFGATTLIAMNIHADAGEPYRITSRQLLRESVEFILPQDQRVYVCENPAVVAAAANRLGANAAPILCLEGQPKTAASVLLTQLQKQGAKILYHGDFDWPGIGIANLVIRRHNAVPWRFDSATYLSCQGTVSLRGKPVAASWEPRLMAVMEEKGKAVFEEQMLEPLLNDLNA